MLKTCGNAPLIFKLGVLSGDSFDCCKLFNRVEKGENGGNGKMGKIGKKGILVLWVLLGTFGYFKVL